MSLRCKVGDIAFITGDDFAENVGCIVEIIRAADTDYGPDDGEFYWTVRSRGRPLAFMAFELDRPLGINRDPECDTADSALRPIRPDAGEDEVLRLAGKPNEMPVDVVRALEFAR